MPVARISLCIASTFAVFFASSRFAFGQDSNSCPDGQILVLQARGFRSLQNQVGDLPPEGQAQVTAAAQIIAACLVAPNRKIGFVSIEGHSDVYQGALQPGQTSAGIEEDKARSRAVEISSFLQQRVGDLIQNRGLDRRLATTSFPWMEQGKGARELANTTRRNEAEMAQNRRVVIEISFAPPSTVSSFTSDDGARHSQRALLPSPDSGPKRRMTCVVDGILSRRITKDGWINFRVVRQLIPGSAGNPLRAMSPDQFKASLEQSVVHFAKTLSVESDFGSSVPDSSVVHLLEVMDLHIGTSTDDILKQEVQDSATGLFERAMIEHISRSMLDESSIYSCYKKYARRNHELPCTGPDFPGTCP